MRNGNPDGPGVWQEPWGVRYEGTWRDGYQDGPGTYVTPEGKRIEGLWDHGELIGAWYADPESGCRVWFAADEEPIGVLHWDGACPAGVAQGRGRIRWASGGPGYISSTLLFEGALDGGRLSGPGQWHQITRYANARTFESRVGTWRSGRLEGLARIDRLTDYSDADHVRTLERTAGQFGAARAPRPGWHESLRVEQDGSLDYTRRRGMLKGGELDGFGQKIEFRRKRNGTVSVDQWIGLFRADEFAGYGKVVTVSDDRSGRFAGLVHFPKDAGSGGYGAYSFAGGDLFQGHFGYSWNGHQLDIGLCQLKGRAPEPCRAETVDLTESSEKTCLVLLRAPATCIRTLSWLQRN